MEPVKRDGKVREQVDIEHVIRRRYARKWGDVILDNRNNLYSHHNANEQMKQIPSQKAPLPYEYTGHGQSYFLSKGMYESLMAVCRCGRPKTDGHILKCLQKVVSRSGDAPVAESLNSDTKHTPTTFNGMRFNRFAEMELSTRYRSPTYDIPGGRIGDHPYSNVYIG